MARQTLLLAVFWAGLMSCSNDIAVGDQGVNVRIEGDQVAEGLYIEYKRRLIARRQGGEARPQETFDQATQLPEVGTVVTDTIDRGRGTVD
jgi:hypothetical protein